LVKEPELVLTKTSIGLVLDVRRLVTSEFVVDRNSRIP
jgi:hypothetical protein